MKPVTQFSERGGAMNRAWQHFKTITHHKWLVLQGCFRVGLYWQGLTHDLSKYSPTEFLVGAKYYQGTRSPNAAEREIKGVYIGDLLSWVMGRAKADDAWITIMSNINIAAVASLADVACVILAEGVTLDSSVTETAKAKGVNILSSEKPAYETAMLLGAKL